MRNGTLPILKNPEVSKRVSPATRRVLEDRVKPLQAPQFLPAGLYEVLQQIVAALLPQDTFGTSVDIAAAIDHRLATGTGAGWRFADLPVDGDAYKQGLQVFAKMLEQTPMQQFDCMPTGAREAYLRSVVHGDMDVSANFPLSKWLLMVKTDAVKMWLSHPAVMEKLGIYSFADGATGVTDGPTEDEGWQQITRDTPLPFERGMQEERRA